MWLLRAVTLMLLALVPLPAGSQMPPVDPRVPLGQLLELAFEENTVIAFDAQGGSIAQNLELGEQVYWHGAQGAVGIVLTDRRILAIAANSGSFQEARYGRGESAPGEVLLGDRVAIMATSQRALGFDGGSGNLIEYRFSPQESLVTTGTGANVVVVVTDRKLLGLSPFVGGFFTTPLFVRERVERISPSPNLVTVQTDHRYLTFRSDSTIWTELNRPLG
ncbi:MAG TPA: hypothetical protein VMS55_02315 [Myxococcota bacterium]|nr:hypothetical protein [Myxococcota bacterium]